MHQSLLSRKGNMGKMQATTHNTTHTSVVPPPWLLGIGIAVFFGVLYTLVLQPGMTFIERLQWLDSGLCAEIATHIFYAGSERLPLCARNTGIYLGFFVTWLILKLLGRDRAQSLPPRMITIFLLSSICLLAIDGSNSLLCDLGLPHLYQPQNSLRLATGLFMGLAIAACILPTTNRLLWCEYTQQQSITSWREVVLFLAALALCFLAVIAQNHWFLYPLALLSTSGIVSVVSIFNLILIISICQREQVFTRYREVLPFFSVALLCALGEMLLLAQLKQILLYKLGF
jgi:uncharacterized membrane protein